MIDQRYLVGGVIGAALIAASGAVYSYATNCVQGTPEQQAQDLARYEPAMLEGLRRGYEFTPLDDVTLEQAAGAASLVWHHLRQCVAARGAEYCKTIGTIEDLGPLRKSRILRSPGSGGDLVIEEAEKHRYLVPDTVPGPSFELLFVPMAESGEAELLMDFPGKGLGFSFKFHFFWRNCTDGPTNATVRLAAISKLKGDVYGGS